MYSRQAVLASLLTLTLQKCWPDWTWSALDNFYLLGFTPNLFPTRPLELRSSGGRNSLGLEHSRYHLWSSHNSPCEGRRHHQRWKASTTCIKNGALSPDILVSQQARLHPSRASTAWVLQWISLTPAIIPQCLLLADLDPMIHWNLLITISQVVNQVIKIKPQTPIPIS